MAFSKKRSGSEKRRQCKKMSVRVDDAEKAAYVRMEEGVLVALRAYPLCSRCVRTVDTNPRHVSKALQNTYERELHAGMN